MQVRKKHGGCTIGPHSWAGDGDAAEVPYDLAVTLLASPDGEFYLDDTPASPPAGQDDTGQDSEDDSTGHDTSAAGGQDDTGDSDPPAATARTPRNRKPART